MFYAIDIGNGTGDQEFRHEAHPSRLSNGRRTHSANKKALPRGREDLGSAYMQTLGALSPPAGVLTVGLAHSRKKGDVHYANHAPTITGAHREYKSRPMQFLPSHEMRGRGWPRFGSACSHRYRRLKGRSTPNSVSTQNSGHSGCGPIAATAALYRDPAQRNLHIQFILLRKRHRYPQSSWQEYATQDLEISL